jgi:hypothetical protein
VRLGDAIQIHADVERLRTQLVTQVLAPATNAPAPAPAATNGSADGKTYSSLWKPVSASKGKPVLVLGAAYRLADFATSPTAGGIVINGLDDQVVGVRGPGNGDRFNFDFKQAGAAYGENAILVLKLKGGTATCTIANGAARQEPLKWSLTPTPAESPSSTAGKSLAGKAPAAPPTQIVIDLDPPEDE